MQIRSLPAIAALAASLGFPLLAHASNGALVTILSDWHTTTFILINILLIGFFFWRFDRFAVEHGPEILTTVGIFGCFFGIALALLDFDARNVASSVPQLLQGVKTAFWASVSGVGGSLIIRLRHRLHKAPIPQTAGAASKAASLDDVVDTMRAMHRGLSGTEEGSLLTQMKLMRQEQNDHLTQLRASFDTYAQKMAEDGSKALIDALRTVIADFNSQINEQFGENFKQLNFAVEKLVLWQQQYKDELDRLQTVQQQSAQDLKNASVGMAAMVDKAAKFSEVAAKLETLLVTMARQHQLIEESQQSLSTVLVQMKDVTPQFSQKLDALADGMSRSVGKLQSDTSELLQNFGVQVKASHGEMKELLADSLKRSQKDVNEELTKSLETIRQGVISLDKGLQEELTKSLETLGRQLASLSEKFVADYSPLTDRLRDIVHMAGQK
ncbi:hypothetical protein [Crenobacter cavernae]|uniref:MotA/TolQ/ExbB proton channel domain-containing protein n=1 Tax=Crenobacter cavernae TaxID=2290923 RepID=A0A345Y7Q8_9NEIS|nr:hypothetical protein [Crenobacter cavernae]AXK39960.1 hypothetical protein DWG20_11200 [Crenobacter cavernae]